MSAPLRAAGAVLPALSPLLSLAGTIAVYALARRAYARTRLVLLSPAVVAIVAVIATLRITHVSYAEYDRGGRALTLLLGPAVVALGLPLALQLEAVKREIRAIAVAILLGALAGILVAVGTALLLGATPAVVRSLAPRSVTTPIAMAISERIGGIPALSAAAVIVTGLFGGVIGPPLLRRVGVRNPMALGLALGAAAHGLGTARATEEGHLEGAMSGLAMGLTGIATAILAPPIVAALAAVLRGRL